MHYLSLSLGPVQDLIASARRCRDLWFGSYLLSEISKAAARGVVECDGLDSLIFPGPSNSEELRPGSALSVANRVVALVKDPEKAARCAEASARRQLAEMAKKAFSDFPEDRLDHQTAKKQLDDLLEFYWVALPIKDYKTTRSEVERLLAARKNTRIFNTVTWGAPLEKSSLDGQRESVFIPGAKLNLKSLRRWGLRPGEQLCGVGALKRLGSMKENRAALSTSHVACGPWLRRQKSSHLDQFLARLQPWLEDADVRARDGRLDGHLFYEERLLSLVEDEAQEEAREALRELFASCQGRPTPYYCILLADGDRMGEAIDRLDQQGHQQLTRRLSKFASQQVPQIVEEKHSGYLIYSGGDDIMAMLSVEDAIECARDLADAFADTMREYEGSGQSPTLSVGLAVRHHLDPLNEGLARVRAAEKLAKKERNSLAISLDKRGGAEIQVCGLWGQIDKRLGRYTEQIPRISNGFAYELRDLGLRMLSDKEALVVDEAIRILKRKEREKGKPLVSEVKLLKEDIGQFGAVGVAQELIVARFFQGSTH